MAEQLASEKRSDISNFSSKFHSLVQDETLTDWEFEEKNASYDSIRMEFIVRWSADDFAMRRAIHVSRLSRARLLAVDLRIRQLATLRLIDLGCSRTRLHRDGRTQRRRVRNRFQHLNTALQEVGTPSNEYTHAGFSIPAPHSTRTERNKTA